MSSSGGGGGGDIASLLAMQGGATPISGLPVAGKDSSIGDPYNYGKFQEFTPEIQETGVNPSATGLRPDMFRYRSPNGVVDQGGGGGGGGNSSTMGGDVSAQITDLRDQLARLASQGQGPTWFGGTPQFDRSPVDTWTNRS